MSETGTDTTDTRQGGFRCLLAADGHPIAGGTSDTLPDCYRHGIELAMMLVPGGFDTYLWTLVMDQTTVLIIPDRNDDGVISNARTLAALEDLFAVLLSACNWE
ncbi:hypothetical protein ACQPW3_13405 [Actinosynnema sp. CA-248983]